MDQSNDSQSKWGFCKTCEWWQIEPDAALKNDTMGLCIDEDLQKFRLVVSGNSGCNHYMRMKEGPARAPGSSKEPPVAQPVR